MKTYYLGDQKILREEQLDNGIVRISLEPHTQPVMGAGDVNIREVCKGLGEVETLDLPSSVLERIRTADKNSTTVLKDWCFPASQAIINVLIDYAVPMELIKATMDIALSRIKDAELEKARKLSGHHEGLETVFNLKSELLG